MTFIYSEEPDLAREIASGLHGRLPEGEVTVCVPGTGGVEDSLKGCGASRVVLLRGYGSLHGCDAVARSLVRLIPGEATRIFIAGTQHGKEVGAYLAGMLGAACISEVKRIEGDGMSFTRMVYGGRFTAKVTAVGGRVVALVVPHSMSGDVTPQVEPRVEEVDVSETAPRVRLISTRKETKGAVDIEAAEVVVSVGRGLKREEDLGLIRELAEVLGGAVGCSRPVSQDLGWLPPDHWIGLSGHKVAPRLYIACGISGQVQHVAGIQDSKVIVAVNTDPKAPIFEVSDYNLNGDMYVLVPEVVKRLREG